MGCAVYNSSLHCILYKISLNLAKLLLIFFCSQIINQTVGPFGPGTLSKVDKYNLRKVVQRKRNKIRMVTPNPTSLQDLNIPVDYTQYSPYPGQGKIFKFYIE